MADCLSRVDIDASGRVDQGLTVCDERLARFNTARSTQFFRALLISARADSARAVLEAFAPQGEETLDGVNLHRFNYLIQCLAGDLNRAQQLSREYRETPHARFLRDPWRHHLLAFTCGDVDDMELIERSTSSRIALCQAHFFIGTTHLSKGDRSQAREHFRAARDLKILGYLEDTMSRTFLVQLGRDPSWPHWIAKR